MARRSSNTLIFDSLLLEGGLFAPAILEKAARGEHSKQLASDYRLPQGLSLTDEQGRAFRIASALWKNFEAVRVRRDVPATQATTGFAIELLRDALGFSDIKACSSPIELADRTFPITAFAIAGRVPVVVAPYNLDLDAPDERFVVLGSGARRRSAYQLAQQFLNASADCTWAIITNGRQLRLMRDADTLTRPAFLDADLELILRDQRYPDFSAAWRLFHATRAGESDASCIWESWRHEGQEQGEPVREGLRNGVTEAILTLGNGFLQHSFNDALRSKLQAGTLTKDAYFQQLLRLIYRCLFVFTVEERKDEKGVSLIHTENESAAGLAAREAYQQGYAFRRFRERALRRAGFDRHNDLWVSMLVVFRGLTNGEARLALPALGGLFSAKQCPDLDNARIDNRSILTAMRHLRWAQISGKLAAIDYRNMGPEELGSVYESLLELVPTIDLPARHFGFVGITEVGRTDGNARKISGSYYTPDSLVQELSTAPYARILAETPEPLGRAPVVIMSFFTVWRLYSGVYAGAVPAVSIRCSGVVNLVVIVDRREDRTVRRQYPRIADLRLVTPPMALEFMADQQARGITLATLNRIRESLMAACSGAMKLADLAKNPFKEVVKYDENRGQVHRTPFSVQEITMILSHVAEQPVVGPVIVTALCTAMRRKNCALLEWQQVDLVNNLIKVQTFKTGVWVMIPLFPALRSILEQIPRNGEFCFPEAAKMYDENPDGLTWRFMQVLLSSGVIGKKSPEQAKVEAEMKGRIRAPSAQAFAACKTTFVTLALNAGIPEAMLRKVVGNKSLQLVLDHYYQPG